MDAEPIDDTLVVGDEPLSEAERFAGLRRQAWDEGDFDLLNFYNKVEGDLRALRVLGLQMRSMWSKGFNDEQWQVLFEAMADAGMLPE
jgi:hypothetical protein